jgi:hypothetical protein
MTQPALSSNTHRANAKPDQQQQGRDAGLYARTYLIRQLGSDEPEKVLVPRDERLKLRGEFLINPQVLGHLLETAKTDDIRGLAASAIIRQLAYDHPKELWPKLVEAFKPDAGNASTVKEALKIVSRRFLGSEGVESEGLTLAEWGQLTVASRKKDITRALDRADKPELQKLFRETEHYFPVFSSIRDNIRLRDAGVELLRSYFKQKYANDPKAFEDNIREHEHYLSSSLIPYCRWPKVVELRKDCWDAIKKGDAERLIKNVEALARMFYTVTMKSDLQNAAANKA